MHDRQGLWRMFFVYVCVCTYNFMMDRCLCDLSVWLISPDIEDSLSSQSDRQETEDDADEEAKSSPSKNYRRFSKVYVHCFYRLFVVENIHKFLLRAMQVVVNI